nr:sulfate ABC transporter substrate-binding protein [Nitrospira sp. KM1]
MRRFLPRRGSAGIHRAASLLMLSLLASQCSEAATAGAEPHELLNVSYDVSREFYKAYNPAFEKYWLEKTGQTVTIKQSHGGSSAQARAVLGGLEADVVTMNQESDVTILSDVGKLLGANWRQRLPHGSVPWTSTIVFLVRKDNPKGIRDWADLTKPGVGVIMPNPKTSGNGRYSYLAAWGQILTRGGTDREAEEFVRRLLNNVPVLDSGGRGATTTFAQRGLGDALLTFEHEVSLIQKELGADRFDVVYPSASILTEGPVAVLDVIVDKHGTRKLAEAYLSYLYSEHGQELAATHHYRPRLASVAKKYAQLFPPVELFTADDVFGGWSRAIATHFTDGGTFDRLFQTRGDRSP